MRRNVGALRRVAVCLALMSWSMAAAAEPTSAGPEALGRRSRDAAAGRPLVVHLVVALCDNANQGIFPVPAFLGNGQDPKSNLYWGAMFGVKHFLARQAGWRLVPCAKPADARILDRVVLYSKVPGAHGGVPVYIVADAWDGAQIKPAIESFLAYARGASAEPLAVGDGADALSLVAGGAAHLAGFVGHDGLMDFSVAPQAGRLPEALPNSCIVLSCDSKPYFLELLRAAGSHPLLLTTDLMAPEAYTLDAAIRAWASGGSTADVVEAAAQAYHKYQKCGLSAARGLFWGE